MANLLVTKIKELEAIKSSASKDPDALFKLGLSFEEIALNNVDAYQYAILSYRECFAQSGFYEAITRICNILMQIGNVDEAKQIIDNFIKKDQNSPILYNMLGFIELSYGKQEKAYSAFERAIEIEPHFIPAYKNLGNNKKFFADDAFIHKALKELDYEKHKAIERSNLASIIGRAFENSKDYETAFEYYKKANDHRRSSFNFSIERVEQDFQLLIDIFNQELIDSKKQAFKEKEVTPIFILGMPRSGTTLVEQILSSHSKILGAGELQYISQNVRSLNDNFPLKLHELSAEKLEQQGDAYLKLLKQHSNKERYICDKMPGNFIYIAMIRLILPNAKIIHLKRNPIDTCLSNYKTMFTNGQSHTYNLEELARYYKSYEKLMAYWHKVMPGFIYDICYEDLIEDPEKNIKPLINFIGLDWEEQCLNFHQAKRSVSTASITQVRQPIYKSSVENWRNFEKGLEPLIQILKS